MPDTKLVDRQNLGGCPEMLAVEELAALIHKSPSSIRSDASRNPSALPPICRLPGNKRLLWRSEDVQDWMALYVDRSSLTMEMSPIVAAVQIQQKKRGRPRKTEMRAVA